MIQDKKKRHHSIPHWHRQQLNLDRFFHHRSPIRKFKKENNLITVEESKQCAKV